MDGACCAFKAATLFLIKKRFNVNQPAIIKRTINRLSTRLNSDAIMKAFVGLIFFN